MRLLTLARDLVRRKARERNGLFVAEGVRTVDLLLRSRLAVTGVLVSDALERTPRGAELKAALATAGHEVLHVEERDLEAASDTENPQGVLAIARQPERTLEGLRLSARPRVLVLDAVQDPGNVGTLLRTAGALGVDATIALPGTVDAWNAKVVRAAVGTHFTHPVVTVGERELTAYLSAHQIVLWGAAADGEAIGTRPVPAAVALAVGNEGAGLTDGVKAACAAFTAIPMAPGAESLNVAVATGILLHALHPH